MLHGRHGSGADVMARTLKTRLGNISTHCVVRDPERTVVFLHGVFFDQSMWAPFYDQVKDASVISLDMPNHGLSSDVNAGWGLDDCAGMLHDVLDAYHVERCAVVGHSWGAMTAVRAASLNQDRFSSLILFNTPMEPPGFSASLGFRMQLLLASFPRFYGGEAAKALLGKAFVSSHPAEVVRMQERLTRMGARSIRKTIQEVILKADSTRTILDKLSVPCVFVSADDDYAVSHQPEGFISVGAGGHVSPVDNPERSIELMLQYLN